MARRIYSEDLVLNLIVNGKGTQQGTSKAMLELHNLEKRALDAEMKLQKVELAIRKLDKSASDYTVRLKKLTAEKRKLTQEINSLNAQIQQQRVVIGKSGMTINQLSSYLKALQIQLRNAGPTQQAYMAGLRKEITQVENRIKQLTTGASRMSIAFERMGTVANKFGTVMSWIAISTFLVARAVGGTLRTLREMDRQFSMTMKTTSLTRNEVMQLKKAFDELEKTEGIKTPTSSAELLDIAKIAGRLGVRGVENIRDFSLAIDKLYVSLGEDMSMTVEELAEKVGRLVNVFQVDKDLPLGEAMLRTGSLINELAKRSAATAPTIVEYLGRLGGVGTMANYGIEKLAGMAAAMNALGVPAERGSTALVKLISSVGQHVDQFSRLLGVSVEEYRRMVDEDINAVFLQLIQSAAHGNAGIIEVVEAMDSMEVSGIRVMETFSKLVSGYDIVIEQQKIAEGAFASAASVLGEYYIVAQDFDALMAVQGKRVKALSQEYAKSVAPAVYKAYRSMIDFVYAMRDAIVWINKHNYLLKAMIALWVAFKASAIVAYIRSVTAAIIYKNMALLAMSVAYTEAGGGIKGVIAGMKAFRAEVMRSISAIFAKNAALTTMRTAYAAAGGGIKGVTAALRVMWTAMLTNPMTALIAVVGAAAAAFFLFRRRADEATKANAELQSQITTQTTAMNMLFDAIEKVNMKSSERKVLIDKLNEVYGKHLPYLLSEKSSLDEIRRARYMANESLRREIALKIQSDRLDALNADVEKKMMANMKKLFAKDRWGKEVDASMLGAAMRSFSDLQSKMAEIDDKQRVIFESTGQYSTQLRAMGEKLIDDYINTYMQVLIGTDKPVGEVAQGMIQAQRSNIKRILDANRELQQEIDYNNRFTNEYLKVKEQDKEKTGQTTIFAPMSDAEYNNQKAQYEMILKERQLELTRSLNENKITDAAHKEEMIKAEVEYLRQLKALEEDYGRGATGELVNRQAEILDLALKIEEKISQLREKPKAEPKEKAEKEAPIKLVDVDKMRNTLIAEERDRALAEELKRYEDEIASYELTEDQKITLSKKSAEEQEAINANLAEAKELAEQIYLRNVQDIHRKYLDQQLADKMVNYQQQLVLLDVALAQEIITQEEHEERVAQAKEDYLEEMFQMRRRYEMLTTEDLIAEELKRLEQEKYYAELTEEEKERAREQIRVKYAQKRAREFKNRIDLELDAIREGFNDLQLDMFDKGQKMISIWQQVGSGIGDAFGALFDRTQGGFAEFSKRILSLTIDMVRQQVRLEYPLILARNISKYAAIPGGQVLAYGATARSIILIEAAFAAAQAGVSMIKGKDKGDGSTGSPTGGKVKQYAKGSWPEEYGRRETGDGRPEKGDGSPDSYRGETGYRRPETGKGKAKVVGADDGRVYDARWVGAVRTGIYNEPSLGLFAERPEMVIDWPTLRNIQFNNPALIDAILAYRGGIAQGAESSPDSYRGQSAKGKVKQYAKGSWEGAERKELSAWRGGQSAESGAQSVDDRYMEVIEELTAELARFRKWKPKVYTELIKKDLKTLDEIEQNRGM